MNDFYNQAKHNHNFLDAVEKSFPNDYFDWKITILFYISIHMLKCWAKQRNVEIGRTHQEIANSLNPRRGKQVTPLPMWVWDKYADILRYSQTSRYNGINNAAIVLAAQKKNYQECQKLFKAFCSYMNSKGIVL